MNRFSFAAFCLLACLVIGAGCIHVAPRLTQDQRAADQLATEGVVPIGVLVLNDGAANILRGDATIVGQDGAALLPGDTIIVINGTVQIVYPDAGASQLEAGTEVVLLPDGEGSGSVYAHVELVAGSIWTRFERLLGDDEKFSVNGNGVVATVRGTGFGMRLANGQADVQVADHAIDVMLLEARKNATIAKKVLRLNAGQRLQIGATSFVELEVAGAKKLIRAVSQSESKQAGFQFASKKLSPELLKRRPTKNLPGAPVIPEKLKDRINTSTLEKLQKIQSLNTTPGFIAPTRSILPGEQSPTSTPSMQIETTTQLRIQ